MVSVCLPSDALLQHLPSYLGFSYLGRGVSLQGCSSKVQPMLLTLGEGYLLTATLPDLQRGIAPLGRPVSMQPWCGVAPPGCRPWLQAWGRGEALQIAVKRREVKSKGEKERYKHLKAEFQRIARRDKKAFLSDQCKEIEEKNRVGKTRDHFKKIRDTKGTFHAKMGSIKDRNGMDLTEAKDIKKRWQEYIEKNCTKKIFMTKIITMV